MIATTASFAAFLGNFFALMTILFRFYFAIFFTPLEWSTRRVRWEQGGAKWNIEFKVGRIAASSKFYLSCYGFIVIKFRRRTKICINKQANLKGILCSVCISGFFLLKTYFNMDVWNLWKTNESSKNVFYRSKSREFISLSKR